MNDPRSSRGWEVDAKRDRPAPSDLGQQDDRVERPRRGLTWIAWHIINTQHPTPNTYHSAPNTQHPKTFAKIIRDGVIPPSLGCQK